MQFTPHKNMSLQFGINGSFGKRSGVAAPTNGSKYHTAVGYSAVVCVYPKFAT